MSGGSSADVHDAQRLVRAIDVGGMKYKHTCRDFGRDVRNRLMGSASTLAAQLN